MSIELVVLVKEPELAVLAMEHTRRVWPRFDKTWMAAPEPIGGLGGDVNWMPARTEKWNDANWWRLFEWPQQMQEGEGHMLTVEHDGYVVQPERWRDEWLEWDYIGAPWGDGVVGNGGFSLRSRKLHRAMLRCASQLARAYHGGRPHEDWVICVGARRALEEAGARFAPVEVAREFSYEALPERVPAWHGSFGVHGSEAIACVPPNLRPGWHDGGVVLRAHVTPRSWTVLHPTGGRGFTSDEEVRLLLDLAARSQGTILEVGASQGATTLQFAYHFPHRKVVGIEPGDTHDGQADEAPRLDGIGMYARHLTNVEIIQKRSERVDMRSLGPSFVFIDGDHRYETVRRDTDMAIEALRRPGIIAWHDFSQPQKWMGVVRAVEETARALKLPVWHAAGTRLAWVELT